MKDTDDKWFDDDETPCPAPVATSGAEVDDALDAFMAGIDQQVTKQAEEPKKPKPQVEALTEEPDAADLFYKHRETHKNYGRAFGNSDEDVYAAAKAVDDAEGM